MTRKNRTPKNDPTPLTLDQVKHLLQRITHRLHDEATHSRGPTARQAADDASALRIILATWDEIVNDSRPHTDPGPDSATH